MNYQERGKDIGKLVDEKQAQYGDAISATGEIMEILFPDGIPKEKLKDALLILRILDKICRLSRGNGEGGESPFRDISGYGLLGINLHELTEAEEMPANSALFFKAVEHQTMHKALSDANSKLVQSIKKFAESIKTKGTRVVVNNEPATGGYFDGHGDVTRRILANEFKKVQEKLPGLKWDDLERVKVREDGTLYLEPATGGPIEGSIMANMDHFDVIPSSFLKKMKREAAARGEVLLSKEEAEKFRKLQEKYPGLSFPEIASIFSFCGGGIGGGEDAKA